MTWLRDYWPVVLMSVSAVLAVGLLVTMVIDDMREERP